MKPSLYLTFLLLMAACQTETPQEPLFPKGKKAPNVHHTGDVWLKHLTTADSTFDYNLVVASFAPGAKLDWHVHPKGQQLIITEGIGYYQERGKPLQKVRKGTVIRAEAGVEHWHAASPDSACTYLAISGNAPTKWLEKLSDAEYNGLSE